MVIAFYLRLSESDGDLGVDGKNESNSIENQRLLLNTYIEARDDIEGEIVEYVDDGYSGTNFNRPAFKAMIEDAKKEKIQMILVKDLSRLGRDYITVGDYIEQIFPLLRVQFIAVNNNYDSSKEISATMGFDLAVNNLINTFYSRDLSKKMRSANKARWKQGINNRGRACFGYLVDREQKGKWVLDPEAAKIVREIFELAIAGNGTARIANYLNDMKYPTPSIYNEIHKNWKIRKLATPDYERLWDTAMVSVILRRYEYTGAMVMGKTQVIKIGSRNTRTQPKDKLIIAEGINDPIVSKEEFELAACAIKWKIPAEFHVEQKYALKGKVRCGNCKQCLCYNAAGYEETFVCSHGKSVGMHSRCSKEKYQMKVVEAVVLYALKNMIDTFQWVGDKAEKCSRQNMSEGKKKIKSLKTDIEKIRVEKIRQYEAYAEGHISKDLYIWKKQELSRQVEQLEEDVQKQKSFVELQNSNRETAVYMTSIAGQFGGNQELSKEMVDAFIKAVYVYNKDRIEIEFLFEDEIRKLMEEIQKGDKSA